jgi:DNA-directed RNA polymerase specialized sigma subunit
MLPRPEKHVARMIFLEGLTEAEAAAKLKLSRIKVHRLKWKVKAILFSSPLLRFLLPPNRPVRDPDR